jgi:hypothetical protein
LQRDTEYPMPLPLILEDNRAHMRTAVDLAQGAGFNELEISSSAQDTHHYLEGALQGKSPMPDAMLIDLDVKKFCQLFAVRQFISKDDGDEALLAGLACVLPGNL